MSPAAPEILMYSSLAGARGSTFSTFDCSPARFIRACALHTWTEIPPCGGGYGPTKSTFINESPAPQLEADQGPQLQVHGTAMIIHVDQPFEIGFIKDPAFDACSRQKQITHERTELSTEPVTQGNGKTAF